jgi:amidase
LPDAHRVTADQVAFTFRPDAEPVLRVQPGDTVRFETSEEPVAFLFAAGTGWLQALDVTAVNAVSGPVFIEGVAPGDAVAVEVLDIETADWGWNAAIPGFGLLGDLIAEPFLERLPIVDGETLISDQIHVPVRPMIGCLGLAPARGETSTLGPATPWGGNFDLTQVSPGATILFPAQVPGGLFSLGDLHAAMGEHEATYVSIECAGAATVRLSVRTGLRLKTPRIATANRVYVMGLNDRGDYDAARRQAARLLFELLTAEAGLTEREAYSLMSAQGDLTLGGPAATIVLASVPRTVGYGL